MIAHALKPGTEVQKVWQLHEAYLFGMHPCHNLTVDCFHTFSGNEQLENIVSLISLIVWNILLLSFNYRLKIDLLSFNVCLNYVIIDVPSWCHR